MVAINYEFKWITYKVLHLIEKKNIKHNLNISSNDFYLK